MFLSVDRIEGDLLICYDDDENEYLLRATELPVSAVPQDILIAEGDSAHLRILGRDDAERDRRLAAIQKRLASLKNR